jgi:CheY-like chemotaxis protein
MQRRKRFGEILVEARVISEGTLAKALEQQRISKQRLGKVLEEMGVVTERDIAAALARQFGFKTVANIAKAAFSEELLSIIDGDAAMNKMVFPLKINGKTLFLAMVNPLDMETIDNLSFTKGFNIVPCVTTPTEIHRAIKRHYFNIYHQIELAAHEPGVVLEIPSEVRPSQHTGWTILVVDDQDLDRAAMVATLKNGGYRLLEAANGVDALKLAMQHNPHLIVSDMIMPRMDGYDLFRTLQANPQTAHIPVIALSARSSVEEEAQLLDMGCCDFLPKPFNPVRLLARVKNALRLTCGASPPNR